MNCKKCGSLLSENDQFCKGCGAPINEQVAPSQGNNQMNQTIGVRNETPGTSNSNVFNSGISDINYQRPMTDQTIQPITQQNTQPTWNNSYNSQPNYNNISQKSNGNAKFIVLGVVIVVIVIAIVLIVGMLAGGKNLSDNNSNSNLTTSKASFKVSFKGFIFEIPDNLVYEEKNGILLIGDEAGTWVTQIELEQGNFSQLKANKSQLQSMMQKSGYTSSIATVKTLGGVEFITMELSINGQKAIAALAKANSMYFIGATTTNLDNEFDYSLLETIAPVIKSAKYSESTSNMEVETKIDMSKFAEFAK